MTKKQQLEQLLRTRILIIDGAMGTMIQQYKLDENDFRNESLKNHPRPLKGNNDLLSITRPDIILAIHRAYLEAGADIIETNTFSSNAIAQADYGLEHLVYTLNYESARLARQAADEYTARAPDRPRFVAGSIGPTNKTASISPDVNDPAYRSVTFDELTIVYKEQIRALVEGGVDILLFETFLDTLNAKAGLYAAMEWMEETCHEYPLILSGTITDASGRTLSGQTTEAFLISVMHAPLLAIGLNCAMGAAAMRPHLQTLARHAPFFTSAYPNAGLPNEMGQYDETPEYMGQQIEEFLKDNLVNIIGGCCGTTPAHIRIMATLAARYKPRQIHA